jgi:multiple RNA-binding domain-containing protein 1
MADESAIQVHLPLDTKSGEPKGFAFVQFENHEQAVDAFDQLDGTVFQGRLLHIIAGSEKRENKLNDFEISKLPLKKQKQIQRKSGAATSTFNWNSLYMNPDAVRSSIAARLGMSKSEVFDPTSSDAAVKQAQAETHIIQETKSFFASNGVDLDAFQSRDRGDTTILVKNFPYGTTSDEIRKLFEETAQVSRVLMPPSGTIAIVELAQVPQARAAFASLAYRKFKDSILFLEKGPKNLFKGTAGVMQPADAGPAAINKPSTVDLRNQETQDVDTTTLFVRNLNFTTTNERFTDAFKPLDGFVSARIKTKPNLKEPGRTLSMGFGFLEFRSKEQAKAALAAMDGQTLDGHALVIKASHKGLDAAEERRKEDQAKKNRDRKSKLIIKNLPFEATKKDVQNLFKSYGQLRAVRLPKKFDNSRKGYAFAEFMTPKEAESAMDALRNTHLLGRRLAIDYAAGDADDAEKEIERMQQKVGRQVNNLALKKLTTASERKKFNIDGGDADEDVS